MRLLLPTILAVALAVGACGGGKREPKRDSVQGLGKADIAAKASAICKRYSAQGKALGSPDLADPAKAEDYFTKAGDLATSQQKELTALQPADTIKTDYDALTKATGAATTLLGDLAKAAGDEDQQRESDLVNKLTPISAAVDTAAKKVGATDCAG